MSRISDHRPRARGGFTLVEIMVATGLSAIIFAGVLSAYLFLGRNLTRLVNTQQQGVASRRALQWFTQDLGAALQFTTATGTQIVLTKPPQSPATSDTVTYAYSTTSSTLTRTEVTVYPSSTANKVTTLLSSLTTFTFNYYNEAGNVVAAGSPFVKSVECTFTSATGSATSGTLASYQMVSPRVILRNKPLLL